MVQLLISKTHQQQIEWRRDRALELSSKGFSQSDIATTLQVDKSIISRDMTRLKHQARENLMTHIQETMPYEYHKSNITIDQALKMCWAIVDKTMDDKTKLQALALIKDYRKYKDELAAGQSSVVDAIKYINQKTEQLNTLKMLDERIEGIDKEIAKEEATSSGVF
jgi:hypothetical protein